MGSHGIVDSVHPGRRLIESDLEPVMGRRELRFQRPYRINLGLECGAVSIERLLSGLEITDCLLQWRSAAIEFGRDNANGCLLEDTLDDTHGLVLILPMGQRTGGVLRSGLALLTCLLTNGTNSVEEERHISARCVVRSNVGLGLVSVHTSTSGFVDNGLH